jgi:predicted Zn-dependent peptidase
MPFQHTQLPNGLTILGETNPDVRSVAVGFFVRTGARDETPDLSGVSHFLEHMVFKGTPRRSAMDVNLDFDRIGANYNAYTSEEQTVFHAAVLPEYLPKAVDIIADILRPSLRTDDFDMEKKVIIEEIGMYDDQPMWVAYEAAKAAFFGSHPLGKSVLGTKESVGGLTAEQMRAYFEHRYVAPNITVVAAGKFEWQKLVDLVTQACHTWPTGSAPRLLPTVTRNQSFQVIRKEKVVQEHLFCLAEAPPAADPLRYAAEIVSMAVGDDSASRLYWTLIDPGILDTADVSYHEYDGTGVYYTYLSGDAESMEEGLALAMQTLHEVQRDGLTEEELTLAKSKLGSRIVRGAERPMGRLSALGYNWTYLKEYRTVEDELASLDAVTLADVRRVLDRYPVDKVTTVALGPLEKLTLPNGNGK